MSGTRWKVAALAGLAGAVMIFILSRPPVLFTFTDPGDAMGPSFTIFNPLRDHAPEQIAERMLTELRRGDVDAAMARVYNGASPEIAEKERRYRLRRWKLVNRVDGPNNVTLYYQVDRGALGFLDSSVTLFMCCRQRGWLISYYLPMY
jgi:hypothetical protein